MTKADWSFHTNPVTDLQRDILEERILSIPKRLARWIATHCPERLLPNKESAGVLDALDGWNEPSETSSYFNIWTVGPSTRPVYPKSITHGNNNNTPSK